MKHPLRRWMKEAGFQESWSDLARRILEQAPELFPKTVGPERHRRLALELSRLEKGQVSWWSNHEKARHTLASILRVPEAYILEGEPPVARIMFTEFPALLPLNPATETPLVELGRMKKPDGSISVGFNLFSSSLSSWERPRWCQVPPGAGKSLALRVREPREGLRARSRARTSPLKMVRRLADIEASEIPDGRTLLVEVESADPRTDLEAVQRLRRSSGLVVLASFARPGAAEEHEARVRTSSWPRRSLPSDILGWKDREWAPPSGWRRSFLTWVAARLGPEHKGFQLEEFGDWLERFDPGVQRIRTPGEVPTLCDLAHEKGTRWLIRQFSEGWKDIARSVTERLVQREAADESSRAFWLRAAGANAIRTLTRTAFEDVASPWPPSSSLEAWSERLPPLYVAPVSDKLLDEKLKAIGQARGERERQKRTQEAKAVIRPLSGIMAIEYLVSARLLRAQPDGALGPHPRWMADALAREFLEDALGRDPETWGRWAADPSRQSLVDDLLDSLPLQRLVTLAEFVVREFAVSRLGLIGAVEALFSAFARRFENAPASVRMELLHALARCQLDVLTRRFRQGSPCPVTRPGLDENSKDWLADCWSWSFSVVAPPWPVPAELHWFFPGWSTPSSFEREGHRYLDAIGGEGSLSDRGLERLLARAVLVLERCCDSTSLENLPTFLKPALLIWAARHGREIEPDMVAGFLRRVDFQELLHQQLRGEEPGTQTAVAILLFRGLARRAGGVLNLFPESSYRTSLIAPVLADWLPGRIEEDTLRRAIEESGPGEAETLAQVPPRVLLPVVRYFCERQPEQLKSFRVGDAGAGHVPVLELLLDQGAENPEVARTLWRLVPESAFQKALQALVQAPSVPSASSVALLFHASPLDRRDALLAALEVRPPEEWLEWAPPWLAREVRRGGVLAERAYALGLKAREVAATRAL